MISARSHWMDCGRESEKSDRKHYWMRKVEQQMIRTWKDYWGEEGKHVKKQIGIQGGGGGK